MKIIPCSIGDKKENNLKEKRNNCKWVDEQNIKGVIKSL
jgi:hypothetical protein